MPRPFLRDRRFLPNSHWAGELGLYGTVKTTVSAVPSNLPFSGRRIRLDGAWPAESFTRALYPPDRGKIAGCATAHSVVSSMGGYSPSCKIDG